MTLPTMAFLLKIVFEFRRNNAYVTQDGTELIIKKGAHFY